MSEREKISAIALTRVSGIGLIDLHELYSRMGSACDIIDNRLNLCDVLPDANKRLEDALRDMDEPMRRAEEEYRWATDNKIQVLTMNDPQYPQRLTECVDAPVVLYYRGNADLNSQKVVSVVGTRHITVYGQDIIRRFMADLRAACPEVLVVSGLAYGVDINAHREALHNGLPTIGVLAHGLDQIYPNAHRNTAIEMLGNGGLLTEYPSRTPGAKGNFIQRNRIVAGMADATILVESAKKGGGMITLGISRDYNHDCFAFPGPVNAEYSVGCNNLIRDNKASLITSAADFVDAMGWKTESMLNEIRQSGIERNFFPDLSEDEQKIVDVLQHDNDQLANTITIRSGLPISRVSALLFQLEMKGVIRVMAGGSYHLL